MWLFISLTSTYSYVLSAGIISRAQKSMRGGEISLVIYASKKVFILSNSFSKPHQSRLHI